MSSVRRQNVNRQSDKVRPAKTLAKKALAGRRAAAPEARHPLLYCEFVCMICLYDFTFYVHDSNSLRITINKKKITLYNSNVFSVQLSF